MFKPMKSLRLVYRNISRQYCTTAHTVDSGEIEHFGKFTENWWDPSGPLRALHSLNCLRAPFIRDGIISQKNIGDIKLHSPLTDIRIIDVGCGGGILSEVLARMGATVTGIDANVNVIDLAKKHAAQENLTNRLQYVFSSIEDFSKENSGLYDAIVASEIIEHVENKSDFVKHCLKCLKPHGSIFVTTINQTTVANFLAIYLGESLDIIPKGTHQYHKFISPDDLQHLLDSENCQTIKLHGMLYNIFTNTWHWCSSHPIHYALHAIKRS